MIARFRPGDSDLRPRCSSRALGRSRARVATLREHVVSSSLLLLLLLLALLLLLRLLALLLLRLRLLLVRRAGREDRLIFVSCARPQVRAPAVAGHILGVARGSSAHRCRCLQLHARVAHRS